MTRFFIGLATATALGSTACAQQAAEEAVPAPEVAAAASAPVDAPNFGAPTFEAPDEAWREVPAENLLRVQTPYGPVVVELYPEIAPQHVERVRTLAGSGFYDGLTFHRVIDGFMNQTGDPTGTGTGDSGLPDLPGEFTFRRGTDMPVAMMGAMRTPAGEMATGFYKALPVATQPSSQAILTKDGKVEAYGLHCGGVTSMARANDPNSANSQFFLMRDKSPWLDAQYSIWGSTVLGHDALTRIKLTEVDGQPVQVEPDAMGEVDLVSDLPEGERFRVEVLDTNSEAFDAFLESQKRDGAYPDICEVRVPARIKS